MAMERTLGDLPTARRDGVPLELHVEQLESRLLLSHTLIVGHRGNSGLAPMNTLVSLRQAFDAGADVVEADVQLSADGAIVLMHDTTVDRTTDGTGAVAQLTLAELKSLDAGLWFSDEFRGEPIPTLAEALQAARGRGILYVDLKADAMGAAIEQVLEELALPDTAIWASANLDYLAEDIHQHLPGTPIVWWGDVPSRGDAEYFRHMRERGIVGFDLEWGKFSRRFMNDAQAHGMFFSSYIINKPSQMRAALRLGLDAIETDYPGTLASLIDGPTDNVTVELQGSTLVVRGDTRDNRIRIERGVPHDSVRISRIHGTLLNNQTEPLEFAGVRDLQITLGRGNDVVEVVDLILEGALSLDSGAGNDHVSIRSCSFDGNSEVLAASGQDRLRVKESAFGRLRSDGGPGADNLDLLTAADADGNTFEIAPSFTRWERVLS